MAQYNTVRDEGQAKRLCYRLILIAFVVKFVPCCKH